MSATLSLILSLSSLAQLPEGARGELAFAGSQRQRKLQGHAEESYQLAGLSATLLSLSDPAAGWSLATAWKTGRGRADEGSTPTLVQQEYAFDGYFAAPTQQTHYTLELSDFNFSPSERGTPPNSFFKQSDRQKTAVQLGSVWESGPRARFGLSGRWEGNQLSPGFFAAQSALELSWSYDLSERWQAALTTRVAELRSEAARAAAFSQDISVAYELSDDLHASLELGLDQIPTSQPRSRLRSEASLAWEQPRLWWELRWQRGLAPFELPEAWRLRSTLDSYAHYALSSQQKIELYWSETLDEKALQASSVPSSEDSRSLGWSWKEAAPAAARTFRILFSAYRSSQAGSVVWDRGLSLEVEQTF